MVTDLPIAMNELSRTPAARASEVHDAVLRVLRSGRYLLGEETQAFERGLAAFVGVEHCIAVASGTDALSLALLVLGAGPGVEVVLAANAGGYGSIAAAQVNAPVVYADVDPETACLTPDSVRAAIGPRTRIVLVTHLYGNVAPVDAIRGVSGSISVIEDCAQAIGGTAGTRRVGSMGTVAAFSFYPTKNLGATGDAGALTTNDAGIAERLRLLRQYGWREKYDIAMGGGRNSRMDETSGGRASDRIGGLPSRNERRREILDHYRSGSPQPQVDHGVDRYRGPFGCGANARPTRVSSAPVGRRNCDRRSLPDRRSPAIGPT